MPWSPPSSDHDRAIDSTTVRDSRLKTATKFSGAEGSRTPDLYSASVALSQLSYGPTGGKSEQSRAYSPTAPAGQPVSRARSQGEPAPGTSTVVARIRAPRCARASASAIAVAART